MFSFFYAQNIMQSIPAQVLYSFTKINSNQYIYRTSRFLAHFLCIVVHLYAHLTFDIRCTQVVCFFHIAQREGEVGLGGTHWEASLPGLIQHIAPEENTKV